MTYVMREPLRMMMDEGIENRIELHARAAAPLRAELEALGLELPAYPNHWLDSLIIVRIHDRIEGATVRGSLLRDYDFEISGGCEYCGKAWRNGLMVDSTRERNAFALLSALEAILNANGYEFACASSLTAANKALDAFAGRAA